MGYDHSLPAPVKNIYKEKMMGEESINAFNGNNAGKSVEAKRKSQRFDRIKKKLLSTPIYLCPERAYLVTDYFKRHDDVKDLMG